MRLHLVFIALCAASLAGAVAAQTQRLDDSASPLPRVQAPMRVDGDVGWTDFGAVRYRLDTRAHVGRKARLVYVLPGGVPGLAHPGGVWLQWRAQDGFASGVLSPGGRVPVWSGVVSSARLDVLFHLTLRVDLLALRGVRGLDFGVEPHFEIETTP